MKRIMTMVVALVVTLEAGVASAADFSTGQEKRPIAFTGSNAPGGAAALTDVTMLASVAYYVTPTGAGAMDGSGWANAFSNIQSALDVCPDAGTIYLQAGSYAIGAQLSLSNRTGVTVAGGYIGSGTPGALNGVNSTIYRGTNNVRILYVLAAPNLTLQRLTLTGGSLLGAYGAGLYVSNCPAFAVLDCTISNNVTTTAANDSLIYGGGIYASASDMTLSNCAINGNQARITGARGNCYGGGVFVNNSTCRVTRSELRGNIASCVSGYGSRGGAICLNSGLLDARNDQIVANDASGAFGYGDGVDVVNGTATLSLCTITGNGGNGVQREAGTLSVTNSILWGNIVDATGTLTLAYCNVQTVGGGVTTNNCLFTDPQFERGLYLASGSPCADAGSDTAANLGVDGMTTRADGTMDAGTVDLGYHYASGINANIADLYVAPGPTGSDSTGDGTQGAPFATITKALSLAQAGTRVHVAAGTYTRATETLPLTILKDGVQILGTNAALTQLSGSGGGGSNLVLQILNSCGDTRLEGLTIANGYQVQASGAGLYALRSELTVASCNLTNNLVYAYFDYTEVFGAGIYMNGCVATVTNCQIVLNNALKRSGTRTDGSGGGLAAFGGRCDIVDSVVAQNTTALGIGYNDYGGGLYLNGGIYSLRNCLVATNSSQYQGDGIYVAAGSSVQLRNVSIVANGGEGLRNAGTATATNSIFWGNGVDVTGAVSLAWCDAGVVDPAVTTNSACLSVDPLFVNPGAGDYHEQSQGGSWHGGLWLNDARTSPCIDAGDPSDPRSALEPQPNGGRINLGAYGGTAQASKHAVLLLIRNVGSQNLMITSADVVGKLIANGASAATVYLYWSTTDGTTNASAWTAGGSVSSLGNAFADGTTFTNTLTGLMSNTTYYWNYSANNVSGTVWGATAGSPSFETLGTPAVNNGIGPSAVGFTTAILNGNLTSGAQARVQIFWGTDPNNWANTIDCGLRAEGSFATNITGLSLNTYYYQCQASNAYGIAWSAVTNFTTLIPGAYFVTPTGAGALNGSGWANAFSNIQSALDVCANTGTVYLQSGGYPISAQLSLANRTGVTISGGYVGSGSPGALSGSNSTIYRGTNNVRILYLAAAPNLTLQRLTLTGGYLPQSDSGAGLYVTNCAGLAVSDCTISNNVIYANGTYCATFGGGVFASGSDVTFSNCTINANQASTFYQAWYSVSYGGGIYVNSGTCRVLRCELRGNQAIGVSQGGYGGRGGAICVNTGLLDARNDLIAANDASGGYGYGDGVDVQGGTATLSLCTIVCNGGSGVQREGGTLAVTNSILWGNLIDATGTLTLSYCDAQSVGGGVTANNCLSADPLFERGLYLNSGSPCVNAGSDTAANLGMGGLTTRADGTTDSGTVDLGCHFMAGNNASVADLFVAPSPNGNDSTGTGTSGAPYATITKALSLAQGGTRVHVAAGTYTNNTNETLPLTIAKDGVQLLGTNAALTKLSGGGTKLVLRILNSCGDTRLEGLTVANGYQTANGGGIYASLSALTMASCAITSNVTYAGVAYSETLGAGLCLNSCLTTITNCQFTRNNATQNSGNQTDSCGGGLAALGGRCDLVDSVIAQNTSAGSVNLSYYDHGGGLYLGNGAYTVRNCLVTTNSSQYDSDGIYVAAGGSAQLRNVTIANNLGEGLHSTGTVTVVSSILWNNGTDVVADVTGAVSLAWSDAGVMTPLAMTNAGCISTDPLFVNPAAGDYHEQSLSGSWHGGLWLSDAAMSPCIDAGDPSDPRGALEPQPNYKNLINMGAYGGTDQASKSRPPGGTLLMVQ